MLRQTKEYSHRYTDIEMTWLIKKGAGRRPALQKTREAANDMRNIRWQDNTQTDKTYSGKNTHRDDLAH